jgi:hypothetical protein
MASTFTILQHKNPYRIISNLKMGGLMPLPFSIVCLCVGVLAHLLRWSDAPALLQEAIWLIQVCVVLGDAPLGLETILQKTQAVFTGGE